MIDGVSLSLNGQIMIEVTTTMYFPPYQQRVQIQISSQPDYSRYATAINTVVNSRWYPLFKLLREPCFTDLDVGRLIELRQEYESGVGRKG
jgi:hypothetical protein